MPTIVWGGRATFGVRGLHGQEQNLAFPSPSRAVGLIMPRAREETCGSSRAAGSSDGVITARNTAASRTFLPPAGSRPALCVAQQCPLLSAAFTTGHQGQVSQAGSVARQYKRPIVGLVYQKLQRSVGWWGKTELCSCVVILDVED